MVLYTVLGKTNVTYFVNLACARALERREQTENKHQLDICMQKKESDVISYNYTSCFLSLYVGVLALTRKMIQFQDI